MDGLENEKWDLMKFRLQSLTTFFHLAEQITYMIGDHISSYGSRNDRTEARENNSYAGYTAGIIWSYVHGNQSMDMEFAMKI